MAVIEVTCSLAVRQRKVERVGAAFLNAKKRHSPADENELEETDEKLLDNEQEVDINYLKSLDPKEWKDQDHYAVLGLAQLRFNATEEQIRQAYRRMVLQHHPDKRKAKGEEVKQEDDYFTCITKAYEILGTPKIRRSYDSVDPQFDDALPTQEEIENDLYAIFNHYFDLNARWSEKKHVPSFGDENAQREDVERFYSFWYDFKSWREFSYLDEEDKERGQDRDERRWIEKENKVARIKRKKEEMQRIRCLVDLAYNNDKRILKFKNEEKERKNAARRAKLDAAQAQKAEQERALREAQLAKERAEKAEQKRIEQLRIEKEQLKKYLKKERKALRDKAKSCQYFGAFDGNVLKNLEGVEKICEKYNLNELQELNKELNTDNSKEAYLAALNTAEERIRVEHEEINQVQNRKAVKPYSGVREVNKKELWCNENLQLLIKAVNLFPAGTSQRWDVIAVFINQHTSNDNVQITARDVLNKAKALQNSDFSKSQLKTQANKGAFESFEKSKKDVNMCADITINNTQPVTNGHAHTNGKLADDELEGNCDKANKTVPEAKSKEGGATTDKGNQGDSNKGDKQQPAVNGGGTAPSKTAWTKEEQALLEQAIKTYPNSTPDRWDRIAESVPTRSKKDCVRRVKELVGMVSAKTEAQKAVK